MASNQSNAKPPGFYKRLRSTTGALLREIKAYLIIARYWRRRPKALIMPSHGKEVGSSLLRGYNIADYLNASGWAAIVCHRSLSHRGRQRIAAIFRPDVIMIQKARHPANLPDYYDSRVPMLFDIDDADFIDPIQKPRIIACLKASRRVIAGSSYTARWCADYNPHVDVVWTGTPVRPGPAATQIGRRDVVAWASSGPHLYPAEAEFVLEVMTLVSRARPQVEFRIYGDIAEERFRDLVNRFERAGVCIRPLPYMPYEQFLTSLEEIAVGLNPVVSVDAYAAGKSFGKALGYLDAKVPAISTPNIDHPLFFEHGRNGYLLDAVNDPEAAGRWAQHIFLLLDDATLRDRLADAARQDLKSHLSLETAGRKVEAIFRQVVSPATD